MALLQGLTRKTEYCTFQHFVEVFFILSVLMTKFPAHHLQKFPTQNLGALQSLKKQWILKWIKTFFWRMSQPQIISPSFRLGWVMQQHNDPKHNEINKCTHEWMKNKEICVFLCPDLNSVEMLWRKWTKTILINQDNTDNRFMGMDPKLVRRLLQETFARGWTVEGGTLWIITPLIWGLQNYNYLFDISLVRLCLLTFYE